MKDVTKRYKGFTLDHASFRVPQGSIVGFVGENGAGKSTTIRAILDLIRLDGGEVEVLGLMRRKGRTPPGGKISERSLIPAIFRII